MERTPHSAGEVLRQRRFPRGNPVGSNSEVEHWCHWRVELYAVAAACAWLDTAASAVRCKSCRAICCLATDLQTVAPAPGSMCDGDCFPDSHAWFLLTPSETVCLKRLESSPDLVRLCLDPAEVHVAVCLTCEAKLGWAFKRTAADILRIAEAAVPPWELPQQRVPGGIDVRFHRAGDEVEVAWCTKTRTWHTRVGATVSVSVQCIESNKGHAQRLDSAFLAFPFRSSALNSHLMAGNLEISTVAACAAQFQEDPNRHRSEAFPLQASLPDSGHFLGPWTGRECGETSFHARWSSGSQSSKRSAVRVFANAASICVHPLWEEAHVGHCELVVGEMEIEPGSDPERRVTWNLRCGVRLSTESQHLCCPSRLGQVEADPTGQSFHGIGPDAARWFPAVSYVDRLSVGFGTVMLENVRAFIDINDGMIWYSLKIQALPVQLSLSLMERGCQQVNGSPRILDPPHVLRKPLCLVPLVPRDACADRTARGASGQVDGQESKQPLIPEEGSKDLATCHAHAGCSGIRMDLSETCPAGETRTTEETAGGDVQLFRVRVRRPASMRSQRKDAWAELSSPLSDTSRPRSPASPSANACAEKSEKPAQIPIIDCQRPTAAGFSLPLENIAVPPGRYMPAQPLPSQNVVVRRKNKSKSPSKKHKQGRRWAES